MKALGVGIILAGVLGYFYIKNNAGSDSNPVNTIGDATQGSPTNFNYNFGNLFGSQQDTANSTTDVFGTSTFSTPNSGGTGKTSSSSNLYQPVYFSNSSGRTVGVQDSVFSSNPQSRALTPAQQVFAPKPSSSNLFSVTQPISKTKTDSLGQGVSRAF